jgi:hypothetical protein
MQCVQRLGDRQVQIRDIPFPVVVSFLNNRDSGEFVRSGQQRHGPVDSCFRRSAFIIVAGYCTGFCVDMFNYQNERAPEGIERSGSLDAMVRPGRTDGPTTGSQAPHRSHRFIW